MAVGEQPTPEPAVRAVTDAELAAALRAPGGPGPGRAALRHALRGPELWTRLAAAVLLARFGEPDPLLALLDEVRAQGPASLPALDAAHERLGSPDLAALLPADCRSRLAARYGDPRVSPAEVHLLDLLALRPASEPLPPAGVPAGEEGVPWDGPAGEDGPEALPPPAVAAPTGGWPHAPQAAPAGDPPAPAAAAPASRPVLHGRAPRRPPRDVPLPAAPPRWSAGLGLVHRALEALHLPSLSTGGQGAVSGAVAARELQYAVELGDGTRRQHAWAPGAQALVVRIAAPAPGWRSAAPAFPEEAVDHGGGDGALLSVLAVVDAGTPQPAQQRQLFLPRQGASSEARVQVDVPPGVAEVRCSVVVHQGARLLQSMEVVGPVRADDEDVGPGLRVVHEANLVSSPAGLAGRRQPDAGLRVGEGGDGVVLQADRPPRVVHLAGLERLRSTLAQVLLDALAHDDEGTVPGSPEQTELLVRLARQGYQLHRALEDDLQPLSAADHVQVVAPEDEHVPLELVYDHGFPAEGARLCSSWRSALETGRCPCRPREGEVRTVCPLGFWGLRKTIERQSSTGRSLPPGSFSLMGQRTATGQLRPMADVLFAASRRVKRVDPRAVSDVEAALQAVPGVRVHTVTNWRAWCRTVSEVRPGMLLALPHNERLRDDLQELHIGRLSRLGVGAVTAKHVGDAEPPPGPVVLLLGCETGVADVPWQSAAAAFRRAGASVVVGCTVPVLGRQVSRLSQLLVEELERTGDADRTLGEAMLVVRRRLLLEGHSLALAVVAFGDADWQLPAMAG